MNLIHQLKQIPDVRGSRGKRYRSGNCCYSLFWGVYAAMWAIVHYLHFVPKIGLNSTPS